MKTKAGVISLLVPLQPLLAYVSCKTFSSTCIIIPSFIQSIEWIKSHGSMIWDCFDSHCQESEKWKWIHFFKNIRASLYVSQGNCVNKRNGLTNICVADVAACVRAQKGVQRLSARAEHRGISWEEPGGSESSNPAAHVEELRRPGVWGRGLICSQSQATSLPLFLQPTVQRDAIRITWPLNKLCQRHGRM